MPESPASHLSALLAPYRDRSRSPYSRKPDTAAVLLSDGTWVPGVRVETASFSLAIGAALNAVTTAVAAKRTDIVAVILQSPASESQTAYLEELPFTSLRLRDHLTFVSAEIDDLPDPNTALDVFLPPAGANTATDASGRHPGIDLARRASNNAFAPLSRFPVGCILEMDDGRLLPGVNVEHPDWNHILCAERNALGTAVTYGCDHLVTAIYISCARDPDGTPCGACRQVITELAPGSKIVMDRGNRIPEASSPDALLPGSFTGSAILDSPDQKS